MCYFHLFSCVFYLETLILLIFLKFKIFEFFHFFEFSNLLEGSRTFSKIRIFLYQLLLKGSFWAEICHFWFDLSGSNFLVRSILVRSKLVYKGLHGLIWVSWEKKIKRWKCRNFFEFFLGIFGYFLFKFLVFKMDLYWQIEYFRKISKKIFSDPRIDR